MSTSTISLLIIIVIGIGLIPFATNGIHTLFKDYMKLEEHKETKKTNQKIEETKSKLKETVDSGNLANLIEVMKELKEEESKK